MPYFFDIKEKQCNSGVVRFTIKAKSSLIKDNNNKRVYTHLVILTKVGISTILSDIA